MLENVAASMMSTVTRLLLDKASPNTTLVEEALSFDASTLHQIDVGLLRKYIVVLGQYLITLQHEENLAEAAYVSWQKALDAHVYSVMRSSSFGGKKMTVKEKVAIIVDEDDHARELNRQLLVAEAKKTIIKNMHKPVEQYINTLKKEIDARDQDRKRS